MMVSVIANGALNALIYRNAILQHHAVHSLTSLVVAFTMTMPGHTLHESADMFYSETAFMASKIGRFIPDRTNS